MLKSPFLLALLLCSLVWNVASFVSPYKEPADRKPPGENRGQYSQPNTHASEAGRSTGTIEIECDPACIATPSDKHRDEHPVSRFFRKTFDEPVAALTGVLAIATFVLAGIVFCQLQDARRAAARQERVSRTHERAYVFGGGPCQTDKPDISSMTIQNYGRTPAFVQKIDWGLCPDSQFPKNISVSDLIDKS
jgi:hypothetical protein